MMELLGYQHHLLSTARRSLGATGISTSALAFGGFPPSYRYSSHRRMVRATNYSNRFNLDNFIIKYISFSMTEKRNIKSLIQQEEAHLNNLLDPNDLNAFKGMVEELRDTWTKKQIFRTETEARISVLQDAKYPTVSSKYWQCVREQNVFLENLMSLSFDYRRNDAKIKWLEKKLETETDEYKLECYKIDLDEKIYAKANMELVARDRMREINMWSNLKKEFDDGSFDTKNVNTHQLESYHQIMKNKAETLTPGSSQPEVFNVLGQLQTIERVKKELGLLKHDEKKAIGQPTFGKPNS
jgi:hypothetical protein